MGARARLRRDKTELLDRQETIRSKSPQGVAQEMCGILIAYNLVRLEMERIADEIDVPPTGISFVAALRHSAMSGTGRGSHARPALFLVTCATCARRFDASCSPIDGQNGAIQGA